MSFIGTHPDHRGKGIAYRLFQEIKNMSDELGVKIWLESTVMGKPFYTRQGLKLVSQSPEIVLPDGTQYVVSYFQSS